MNRFILIMSAFAAPSVSGLRKQFATANAETATGTHEVLSRRTDAAHTYTHLLVKTGSDAFHAAVAGASDYPIGSTTDAPDNAEDIFNVRPLNSAERTRRLRCATALAADIDVYTAANGFCQAEPGLAGTYYKVGRTTALAVQEASSLYTVEVTPCDPIKLVVLAALTSAQNATAAATDLATSEALANALKANYNALQVDVAALATAMATPCLLKHL